MFNWQAIPIVFSRILEGLELTMVMAVLGILFGFVFGVITGYARTTRSRIAYNIAGVYIWLIRSTPIMVQALYIYFVIPNIFKVNLNRDVAGVIAVSLNAGAYIAEIVRGAILEIPKGQWEAGYSLGMTKWQILSHLIFPPAFRNMLPALGNQFIITVKDTSILTVIGVAEMTYQASQYAASTFNLVESYTMLAVFYLVFISLLTFLLSKLEKKMGVGKL